MMVSHQLLGKLMVDYSQVDLTIINNYYTTTFMKQPSYTITYYNHLHQLCYTIVILELQEPTIYTAAFAT